MYAVAMRISKFSPPMSGITATPVSKPERPRASFGKRRRETPIIPKTLGCCVNTACFQLEKAIERTQEDVERNDRDDGVQQEICPHQHHRDSYSLFETSKEDGAQPAEKKQSDEHLAGEPLWGIRIVYKMRRSIGSRERVMVIIKSVDANPSRASTNALPPHLGKSFSSIAMDPWPFGLTLATRL